MPTGKLAAQAGHAYESSLYNAQKSHGNVVKSYKGNKGGSKVTTQAKNENALIRAYNQALADGLPCALIIDNHHYLPPHFDGTTPVITALGIGPVTKSESKHITKRFSCV